MFFSRYRNSFWRVPLIALVAGWLYTPCYVRIALRFGVVSPGVIDEGVSLLASGGLLAATLVLGWAALLRRQTRADIAVSASLVVANGMALYALQALSGSTTGPAAVVFLHLETPLEWTAFPTNLGLYLQSRGAGTVPGLGLLRFFVPWLFIAFGRRAPAA